MGEVVGLVFLGPGCRRGGTPGLCSALSGLAHESVVVEEAGDGFGVFDLMVFDHLEGGFDGDDFGNDVFAGFQALRDFSEAGGQIAEHDFGADAGAGEEGGEEGDFVGFVAGFFFEFTGCAEVWRLWRLNGPGGEFPEGLADGDALVFDHDDVVGVQEGEDDDSTGVDDDLLVVFLAGGVFDGDVDDVEAFAVEEGGLVGEGEFAVEHG